jgi:hypothetical protein
VKLALICLMMTLGCSYVLDTISPEALERTRRSVRERKELRAEIAEKLQAADAEESALEIERGE